MSPRFNVDSLSNGLFKVQKKMELGIYLYQICKLVLSRIEKATGRIIFFSSIKVKTTSFQFAIRFSEKCLEGNFSLGSSVAITRVETSKPSSYLRCWLQRVQLFEDWLPSVSFAFHPSRDFAFFQLVIVQFTKYGSFKSNLCAIRAQFVWRLSLNKVENLFHFCTSSLNWKHERDIVMLILLGRFIFICKDMSIKKPFVNRLIDFKQFSFAKKVMGI